MNKFLKWGAATVATLGAGAAMAAGTVPVDIQTAITDSSDTGKAVLIAVVTGLAVIGLLRKGFSKAGV